MLGYKLRIIVFFALGLAVVLFLSFVIKGLELSPGVVQQEELIWRKPIYINGNENFTSENGVLSGNGTIEQPYIIGGWAINATTANGIEIRNTDAYFVISNCKLRGENKSHVGIHFYNVTHGIIENVTSTDNLKGIEVLNSPNNIIVNCSIYDNYYYGIFCEQSPNSAIANVTVYNNSYWGFYINYCHSSLLENVTIYNNTYGLVIRSSSNTRIANCIVHNNTQEGVWIRESSNCVVRNSTLENNHYNFGVYGNNISYYYQDVDTTNKINGRPIYYVVEHDNLIYENLEPGYLAIISSSYAVVKNLTLSNNYQGILLANVTQATITNCTFHNNRYGLYSYLSSNSTVIECKIYNNSIYGVCLYETSDSKIANCSLYGNDLSVGIDSSWGCVINNCTIYNSSVGIATWASLSTAITNSKVSNNTYGIKISSSSNATLRNNTLENNKFNFGVLGWNIVDYYHDIDATNTINSEPVYYIINQTALVFNQSMSIGYLGFVSCYQITIENVTISNNLQGLLFANVSQSAIVNSTAYNNSEGFFFWQSSYNNISDCSVYNNQNGLSISYSSSTTLTNCTAYNNEIGLRVERSTKFSIIASDFYNNSVGSTLLESSENAVVDSLFYNNKDGIALWSSSNNKFKNCSSYFNSENGFYLLSSSKNNIIFCTANNNKCGFSFKRSLSNNVTDSKSYSNQVGFKLELSSDNVIVNSVAYSNQDGFYLLSSLANNLTNCTAYYNSRYGVFLRLSSFTAITGCTTHNNSLYNIFFSQSSNNTLRGNLLENSKYNFGITGSELSHYYQSIDTSNKINGKSVYYIVERNNLTFDENIDQGYLAFISCSSIIVRNLTIFDNYQGILLANVTKSIVVNFTAHNNFYGIYLFESSATIITNSKIYNNSYGIAVYKSLSIKAHYSDIYNNINYGAYNSNLEQEYLVNATYNWWGSVNGPNGEGDNVSSNIYFALWLAQPMDLTPPIVELTSPANGAVNIPLSANIIITFSKVMDCTTIIGNISITPNAQFHAYVWSPDYRTITLEPASNMFPYTIYNLTISNDVKDTIGNKLISQYQFWFRTKDIIPPIITIISPSNNTITNSNVTLIYLVEDNVDASEDIVVNLPNGTVYGDEGVYIVTVEAKDSAGNLGFQTVVFTIDKSLPEVVLVSPENNTITNQNVVLSYSVSDNIDTPEQLQANLESGTIYTEEKDYVICLEVSDRAGNVARKILVFRIDKTAPKIIVSAPSENELTNKNVTLSYSCTDNFDTPENITVNIPSGTVYTAEDSYTILLRASDCAGNEAKKLVSFTIDKTPPEIVITAPYNNTVTDQNITLSYFATDNFDAFEHISFNIDNNTFYELEGLYTILLTARDRAGNTGFASISFIIDRTPPGIVITGVEDGKYYNTDIVVDIEILDLSVNETKTILNNESFESGSTITQEGLYLLVVDATDKLGRSSKKELYFVIDKTKPFISEVQPYSGTRTYEDKIMISGKAEKNSSIKIKAPQGEFTTQALEGIFNLEIQLWTGNNTIIIKAVDLAGNEETVSLEVIKEEEPPPYYYTYGFPILIFIILLFTAITIIVTGLSLLREE